MNDIYEIATEVMPVVPTPYVIQQNAVRLPSNQLAHTPELPAVHSNDYVLRQQRLDKAIIVVCIILTIGEIVTFALLFWLFANILQ